MILLLFLLALFSLIYGPFIWVKYVLWRHSKHIETMPGTGGELAKHLVERFELDGVSIQKGGKDENFYAPDKKLISLSPDIYDGKSLTAVSVAAHEVGHAIQFCKKEPVSKLRSH